MKMVEMCEELGNEFPIKWTLESATAAWNPRSLAKLFADIVLVNNPSTGCGDWLVTADNHVGGSLYQVTSWLIEHFKKPVPSEQELVSSSIWVAGGNFADTGMRGIVFRPLLQGEGHEGGRDLPHRVGLQGSTLPRPHQLIILMFQFDSVQLFCVCCWLFCVCCSFFHFLVQFLGSALHGQVFDKM